MIRETVVVTVNAAGEPHIAPLGLIAEGDGSIWRRFILRPRSRICASAPLRSPI